ncbi:hypothetical protein CC80DRAFT_487891 [Byssothecium circinans]|uniref:Uncharacterized protein n=1 Tax=Byssothecium circinans TaxID=147558 RepID=A0A6A5UHN9_9PLEO|nr:hypothetical protein CC80DRAFT_487891 [Byssothecium circinans]
MPRETRSKAASAAGPSKPYSRQQQQQSASKSSRAQSEDKAVAPPTASTPAVKRRLRSDKNASSPLASLPEPSRKKPAKGKGKASAVTSELEHEQSAGESVGTHDASHESEDDSGAGIFFQKFRKTDKKATDLERENDEFRRQMPREYGTYSKSGSGSKAWYDLVHGVEDAAALAPRPLEDKARREAAARAQAEHQSSHLSDDEEQDTTLQSPQVATANSTPAAPTPAPPQTQLQPPTTPQSQGFFGRLGSFFISPLKGTPTPATPADTPVAPVTPTAQAPLTTTLTQAPTPVGDARPKSRRRKINNRRRIVSKIAESVPDHERAQAEAWANQTVDKMIDKLSKDIVLGDKRKRLERGIKVGELKTIQATKPWRQGSFGMDDDIGDLSDDDDAPAWAVLQDLMEEVDTAAQPPAKRHKPTHDDDVTNGTAGSSLVFNSNGKSASIHDLKPRPAAEPSPMFDMPAVHRDGSNVFDELQGQPAGELSAADRRAAVKDATPKEISYNSFSVPEDSDEDEDFSQGPPPAPVPAHASLPAPLVEAQRPQDPVELQRAKAMKFTPAKPSRLRQAITNSPSLKSDAGASPAPIVVAATADADMDFQIPDANNLDVPDEVLHHVAQYFASGKAQAAMDAQPWDDAILVYDEDEDISD